MWLRFSLIKFLPKDKDRPSRFFHCSRMLGSAFCLEVHLNKNPIQIFLKAFHFNYLFFFLCVCVWSHLPSLLLGDYCTARWIKAAFLKRSHWHKGFYWVSNICCLGYSSSVNIILSLSFRNKLLFSMRTLENPQTWLLGTISALFYRNNTIMFPYSQGLPANRAFLFCYCSLLLYPNSRSPCYIASRTVLAESLFQSRNISPLEPNVKCQTCET